MYCSIVLIDLRTTICQCFISRHNGPYKCVTCSLWLSSSWLTCMISSILPKKSTERAKLRTPIANSSSIAFLLLLSSWFLQFCESPISGGFYVLTVELRTRSSGYDDLPSCEAWEIGRYLGLLEGFEGALYLATSETSRSSRDSEISAIHVIGHIKRPFMLISEEF